MMNLPLIETDRLLLCDLSENDVDQMFSYTTNPKVSEYLFWSVHSNKNQTIDAIKNYKSNEQMMQWAIKLKATNKLIGVGGFGIVNKIFHKADLGYSFNPDYWNNGYATEMTIALIEYGFNKMNLVRIQGAIHPDNIGSEKVLEKSGLVYEATLKKWMQINNQSINTKIFAITSDDFYRQ